MSTFSDWIGAQELRDASMGLDDPALADRTAALESRNSVLLAQSERLDRTLGDLAAALTDTRGEGEAESGAVKVIVDAQTASSTSSSRPKRCGSDRPTGSVRRCWTPATPPLPTSTCARRPAPSSRPTPRH